MLMSPDSSINSTKVIKHSLDMTPQNKNMHHPHIQQHMINHQTHPHLHTHVSPPQTSSSSSSSALASSSAISSSTPASSSVISSSSPSSSSASASSSTISQTSPTRHLQVMDLCSSVPQHYPYEMHCAPRTEQKSQMHFSTVAHGERDLMAAPAQPPTMPMQMHHHQSTVPTTVLASNPLSPKLHATTTQQQQQHHHLHPQQSQISSQYMMNDGIPQSQIHHHQQQPQPQQQLPPTHQPQSQTNVIYKLSRPMTPEYPKSYPVMDTTVASSVKGEPELNIGNSLSLQIFLWIHRVQRTLSTFTIICSSFQTTIFYFYFYFSIHTTYFHTDFHI